MSWVDHAAIFVALVVAIWSMRDASRAYRAAIVNYLRLEDDWVRGGDLVRAAGPAVYKILRDLVDDGLVEREETDDTDPVSGARGGRPSVLYRWKGSA